MGRVTKHDQRAWAYCDVRPDGTITYYGVADAHRMQPRPNIGGVESTRWVEEAVAWLGLQGWELVAVSAGADRTYYFKRPIDTASADLDTDLVAIEVSDERSGGTGPSSEEDPDLSNVDRVRLIEEECLPD
jgi:hypothetical protein